MYWTARRWRTYQVSPSTDFSAIVQGYLLIGAEMTSGGTVRTEDVVILVPNGTPRLMRTVRRMSLRRVIGWMKQACTVLKQTNHMILAYGILLPF